MDNHPGIRALSHDERHAAEAAFSGRPFDPRWSARARLVYEGILSSLPPSARPEEGLPASTNPVIESTASQNASERNVEAAEDAPPAGVSFQSAIDSGALIDVTSTAEQLGLSFTVTVTKRLWDSGIAPSETVTPEEQSSRLRDVLMAFRLRLAAQPTLSPVIDFPALLAFPPGTIPRPMPLLALIQPNEPNQTMITLLLPNEVATTIIPMN